MTHLKTIFRTLYITLTVIAALSAPLGAMYGYLAWQEARFSSQDTAAMARALKSLQAMTEEELAQRERDLKIQQGLLKAISKLLPEAERTRLGIERLVHLNEKRLADVRSQRSVRGRQRQSMLPRRNRPPKVLGWWDGYGPGSKASHDADRILAELESNN